MYTIIDDLYQTQVASQLPRHPGQRPQLSDSEVLTLGLSFPGARSAWGLLRRIVVKVAARNLGTWLHRLFGRPDLALATLFPA